MFKRSATLLAALTFCACVPGVYAHELRALADPYRVSSTGEATTIFLSWGHSAAADSPLDAETIERYDLILPDGTVVPLEQEGFSVQANEVELAAAGVYQVAASRQASVMTYVFDDEGNRMMRRGPKTSVEEGDIDFAQRSQHTAKALLVAGTPTGAVVEPVGLPVEIVPLDGPAQWRAGGEIRFQVLLQGQPAIGELLLAAYDGFEPEEAWCYALQTDREGIAPVRIDRAGTWTLMTRIRKLTGDENRALYDFDTYTTTLTLDIRP